MLDGFPQAETILSHNTRRQCHTLSQFLSKISRPLPKEGNNAIGLYALLLDHDLSLPFGSILSVTLFQIIGNISERKYALNGYSIYVGKFSKPFFDVTSFGNKGKLRVYLC